MRIRDIQDRLEKLHASSPDIEGVALANPDGFIIACVLAASLDEERVASATAAFQSMADRCARELEKGRPLQTLLKTEGGFVVITRVGEQADLSVVAGPQGKAGMLLLEARQAAEEILAFL